MKDYEICIEWIEPERSKSGLFKKYLGKLSGNTFLDTTKTEECIVIRTEKNEEEVREYYRIKGYKVTGISKCAKTKNQELEII